MPRASTRLTAPARRLARLCCAIAPLIMPTHHAVAQAILVAPQGVVLSNRERSGTVELYNPSDRAAEVTIHAVFGHPVTTPEGDLTLQIVERPDSTQPSAAGWVDAFPRRLILLPNQRQTVRLLARPPVGLGTGEYWARLVISSKDAEAAAAPSGDSTAVSIGLSLEVRTIIAVNYRNGTQQTGVELGAMTATTTADSVILRAPMQRTGGAAWIGTTTVKLINAQGSVIAKQSLQTAVYQSISPRFAFSRLALPAGEYRLSVDVSTDRPDVIQGTLLRSPPQHAETSVTVPGPQN